MARKIWFRLVDENGDALMLSDYVKDVPDGEDLVTLRKSVKAAHDSIVTGDSARLKIYKNQAAYAKKDRTPLRSSTLVDKLGRTEDSAVIVEVWDPSKKRQKTLWQETTTLNPSASTLSLSGRGHVWKVDPADISGFGLLKSDEKLCLYCRDDAADLIAFLRDDVVRDGHTGFVLGPPGSGKSTTAAVFALALPRTSAWVVTWIHLINDEPPICVRLEGNEKKTCELVTPYLMDLSAMLYEVEDTKQHMVFLDGVTQDTTKQVTVCTGWVRQKWETRRLALVTSLSSRGKVKLDDDVNKKAMEFAVSSWSLDEYSKAVEDDELFQCVSPRLDASDDEDIPTDAASLRTWRELILLSKCYFAGGSVRNMFGYTTARVMQDLNKAVSAVEHNPSAAIGVVGERSDNVINRLYGSFGETFGLISRYAASALALQGGAELIKRFASILKKDSNAAMEGWILEMYFFARIRKGGLVALEGTNEVEFPQSDVVVVDPKNLPVLPAKCWLKPQKFNQGGYDAVYIDKNEGLVRFVQITKSAKHSFLIHYFRVLLDSLEKRTLPKVKKIEIFFVIEKQKLSTFTFSTVMGQGNLEKFNCGWTKNEESSKVRRVAVEGVESWDVLGW